MPAIEKKHRSPPSSVVSVSSPLKQSWVVVSVESPSTSLLPITTTGEETVPPLSPTSSLWSNSSYSSSSSGESSEEDSEGEENAPVKVVEHEHESEEYSYTLEDVVAIKALPARRRSSAGLNGVEGCGGGGGEGEVRGLGF